MLGNQHITPAEFERCKDILVQSGALDYSHKEAEQHSKKAVAALQPHKSLWTEEGVAFLEGLANFLLTRTA